MKDNSKIGQRDFCDLMCVHARLPKEQGIDGSGSCRTFIAVYCRLKKSFVPKNAACGEKRVRKAR
jgi:hypothetical protein